MELTSSAHPAQSASIQSMRNVRAKKRDAWLALFAADAVVQDPVGQSPLDPVGEGHRGPITRCACASRTRAVTNARTS